jgi:hypothetical protein
MQKKNHPHLEFSKIVGDQEGIARIVLYDMILIKFILSTPIPKDALGNRIFFNFFLILKMSQTQHFVVGFIIITLKFNTEV